MKTDNLVEVLERIYSYQISSLEFDILRNRIEINAYITPNDIKKELQIIFMGVSSFYFVENIGENRFRLIDPELNEYLELTSIGYYPKGIGKTLVNLPKERWAELYYSNPNLALEIWSSMLLIEARNIIINGKEYKLSFLNQ